MAKRTVKKATAKKAMGRQAARKKNTAKKPIESYDHQDKKRANNPPVGMVTPQTDPERGAQRRPTSTTHTSTRSSCGRARPQR